MEYVKRLQPGQTTLTIGMSATGKMGAEIALGSLAMFERVLDQSDITKAYLAGMLCFSFDLIFLNTDFG